MKTLLSISVLVFLLVAAPRPTFAMMSIEEVSKERAKELGLQIQANAAGPDAVRVVLAFKTNREFKDFSRVDLEIAEGGKLLVSASLREEGSSPGRVVVSFAADRAHLDKITLRVVVQSAPRDMNGYDLRIKDFVDLKKLH